MLIRMVAKGELAETALQCMCSLLVEATHFNFRVNLMNTIVAYLSRKSWDQISVSTLSSRYFEPITQAKRHSKPFDFSIA